MASTALVTVNAQLGYGKHIWDIPIENFLFKMPLIVNISATFAILAAAWSKTSFAITLLRISQGWMWITVWCIIASMNILLGLSALFVWIQCTPIEKSWNLTVEGSCYPMGRIVDYLMISTGESPLGHRSCLIGGEGLTNLTEGYSALMDIVLALLPWKLIWPLNMRKKEKIGAIVAMSMGVFAGITGIIKLVQTPRMKEGDVCKLPPPRPPSIGRSILPALFSVTNIRADNGVVLIIWSTAESSITMMAASVPVLRTLLRQPSKSAKQPIATSPKRAFTGDTLVQNPNTVVIESSNRGSSEKGVSFWGKLGDEEKEVGHVRMGSGQIWRINEVAIEYETREKARV